MASPAGPAVGRFLIEEPWRSNSLALPSAARGTQRRERCGLAQTHGGLV